MVVIAGPPAASASEGEALRRRATAIRDFLRGRLDPAVDPEGLFTLDLAASLGEDPGAALARLRPTAVVETYGLGALRRVGELLAAGPGATIAVIAERGVGKTTFLDRVRTGPGMEGAVRVGCRPGGGFDALVADLWTALGLEGDPSIVKLAQAVRERRPPAVLVDDAQRIVRPVIGGLVDVDRLLALARAVGTATSWIVAIGTPGYGYLERARASRVTFDEVVRLDPWTLEETADLLRARTRAAGVAPTFGELVAAGSAEGVAEESRLERAERDFHGLLWDSSGGNAAVAPARGWRSACSGTSVSAGASPRSGSRSRSSGPSCSSRSTSPPRSWRWSSPCGSTRRCWPSSAARRPCRSASPSRTSWRRSWPA